MWKHTDRYEDGEGDYDATADLGPVRDPNAYWRRRFFILGGGVVVAGLCVWLFPGASHPAARAGTTAKASMAALEHRGTLPPAAYGSPYPGPTPKRSATPAAVARPSAKPSAMPTAKPAGKRKAGTGYRPSVTPSPSPSASGSAAARGPRCAPSDIVLSLFTSQPSYRQGAAPAFDLYAVSTSAGACALGYGPGSVQVVVTRHGRVVWDSSACKLPGGAAVRFTLGVPQVLSISWNRQATYPSGCAGTLSAGAWGTFDAVALTDGQSSPVRVFTLSR